MPVDRLPDFLVIGAPRSGTTWMWEWMRAEPRIFVPEEKEVSYFNVEAIDFPDRTNPRSRWAPARYAAYFSEASPDQVCGELSPAYLASESAPERIRSTLPDVRLIAVLREPVDRTISDYRYRQGRGTVKPMTLGEAIDADPSIVSRGFYAAHLNRYLEYFDPSQILLLDFCHLRNEPQAIADRVGEFLGVEFSAPLPSVVNPSGAPRHRRLNRLLSRFERAMRQPPFDNAWRLLRSTVLRSVVRAVRRPVAGGHGDAATPADRARLEEIFDADRRELASTHGFTFAAGETEHTAISAQPPS